MRYEDWRRLDARLKFLDETRVEEVKLRWLMLQYSTSVTLLLSEEELEKLRKAVKE